MRTKIKKLKSKSRPKLKGKKLKSKSSSKVESLKSSLTQTRKVIAEKFQQLHRNRQLDEKKRQVDLAPLTETLKKVISQRGEIERNRNEQHNNVNQILNDEVDMINDDDGDDFRDPPPQYSPPRIRSPPPPPPPPVPSRNRQNVNEFRRVATPPIPPRPRVPINQMDINGISNDQMHNFFNNIIQNTNAPSKPRSKRKQKPIESDENEEKIGLKTRRRNDNNDELLNLNVQSGYNSDDGAVGGVNCSQMSTNDSDIITDDDENEEDMHSIVSPEDFDDSGNFRGPGIKRRKMKILKSKLKNKIKRMKRRQKRKKSLNKQNIVDNKSSLSILSPDDYDDFGEYHGPGVKRSKLEMDENNRHESLNRIKSRKVKKMWRQISDDELYQNDDVHPKELEQNFKRYKKHLTTLYPDHFDKNGSFVGTDAEKRHLGRISLHLSRSSGKGMKRSRRRSQQKQQKKISINKKSDVEKNFIPYSDNIVYEYYDDPNELCDRLNLLIASQKAGNTNHNQEINSIIEELRERGIVN